MNNSVSDVDLMTFLLLIATLMFVSSGCLAPTTVVTAEPQEEEEAQESAHDGEGEPSSWRADGLDETIEGCEQVTAGKLQRVAADVLLLLEREGERYLADDAAFMTEDYYLEQGYHLARVDYELEPGTPPRVVFHVVEGPRAVLAQVVFRGRHTFSRERLMECFEGPTTVLVGGETIYVESRVEDATRLIRGLYRSSGGICDHW